MVAPSRGKDKVAAVHLDAAPVDSREAAVALDDKAARKGSVAMSWGSLSGHYELETSVKRVGGTRRLC